MSIIHKVLNRLTSYHGSILASWAPITIGDIIICPLTCTTTKDVIVHQVISLDYE
jgi:hypothetical protein